MRVNRELYTVCSISWNWDSVPAAGDREGKRGCAAQGISL
jgi:hypothetical protein